MMDSSNRGSISTKSEEGYAVRRRPRVLLAACGCSDAAKFGLLCQHFSAWANLAVVLTQSSLSFINVETMPNVNVICAYSSNDYLEWADVMVIAPLSANTLSKIAGGLADNLLTEIVRGWDRNKPLFVAPSMDRLTWNNPLTGEQCKKVEEVGISIIPPSPKRENEFGSMAEPYEISYTVKISNDEFWDYHTL